MKYSKNEVDILMLNYNICTDAHLEGKTVLLVGEGLLGLVLQSLMERNGMIVLKSNWGSKSHLQSQVCLYVCVLYTHCFLTCFMLSSIS